MFIVVNALEQAVEQVAGALLARARLNNAREHVAAHSRAAHGQLGHHAAHEGHDAGRKVHEAAVVHLPEDLVELLDVLGMLGVAVLHAGRVAEVAVENVGASLIKKIKMCLNYGIRNYIVELEQDIGLVQRAASIGTEV